MSRTFVIVLGITIWLVAIAIPGNQLFISCTGGALLGIGLAMNGAKK